MDGNSRRSPRSEEELQKELEHSYAVAKRLLPFLAKRGIPATPNNYRIFFDYLLNANPALNKAINELLKNNAKFYHQLSATVYQHFYSKDTIDSQAEAVNKATEGIMAVSNEMGQSLENVINQTSYYKKILNDTSRQVTGVTSSEKLQPVLDELLSETEAALKSNGVFFDQLNEASQTIANLKAELHAQATLAKVDELTKLYNRRHLNAEMPQIMANALANNSPLSLALFDLDHFKRINDSWGHNFGDKVLIICANIIKKTARSTDMAVRLGGEELLVVLPGLDLQGAARVAERVRNNIANTDITIHGQSLMVTVSGGVSQFTSGDSLDSLIERADKALYQAKMKAAI